MRRVELFELIRHDFFKSGLSRRDIEKKRGVGRRTINQAIENATPPDRKRPVRTSPQISEEVRGFIHRILETDKAAPRKQRHTARRIWQRLRDELGSTVAESTVRNYVREAKRALAIGQKVFVPQHHEAGKQGEADFYEASFDFPWGRQVAQVITVRSEFSAGALHVAFPVQTQAALFEGMEKSFEFLGGSFETMRFDNLPLAVAEILKGKRRVEKDRFIAFRSHHLFQSSFTTPGIEGAHEKGGIEGEVGRFRRKWLTPVPVVENWEQANDYLLACSIRDMERNLEGEDLTVGEKMDIERDLLRPLPKERFETAELLEPRVDEKSRIQVKRNFYSVPESLAGRKVSVRLSSMTVEASYAGKTVATHERSYKKGQQILVLDHYLDVLIEKPGAFPGSLPLHQARLSGEFPKSYDRLWSQLVSKSGQGPGTRQMIEVMLLHRTHTKSVVREAVDQALLANAIDPSAVELFCRHIETGCSTEEVPAAVDVGALAIYDRPLPETVSYDDLLDAVAT